MTSDPSAMESLAAAPAAAVTEQVSEVLGVSEIVPVAPPPVALTVTLVNPTLQAVFVPLADGSVRLGPKQTAVVVRTALTPATHVVVSEGRLIIRT